MLFELHCLLQPITGYIGLHFGDHVLLRFGRIAARIAILAQAIDSVAHDERRFGRVEDDDCLAARRAADVDDGLRLVVSVNSSILARVPGPALFRLIDATISP
jgi:hypothetical protein